MSLIELASLGIGLAQNPSGGVLGGLTGTIYVQGTTNPVTVWSSFTGGTPNSSGTFVTDPFGRIPGWVDPTEFPNVDITIPPATKVSTTLPSGSALFFVDGGNATSTYVANIDGGAAS